MTDLMPLPVKVLHLNGGFTVFDTNVEGQAPWPFQSRYHRFTAPDHGDPHDHPFAFEIAILRGGYIEEAFYVAADGSWRSELIERRAGTSHRIEASHIHRIVQLLEPECWTHVITGPGQGNWRIWTFEPGQLARSRFWNEPA